jgi:hypothetical protein
VDLARNAFFLASVAGGSTVEFGNSFPDEKRFQTGIAGLNVSKARQFLVGQGQSFGCNKETRARFRQAPVPVVGSGWWN